MDDNYLSLTCREGESPEEAFTKAQEVLESWGEILQFTEGDLALRIFVFFHMGWKKGKGKDI